MPISWQSSLIKAYLRWRIAVEFAVRNDDWTGPLVCYREGCLDSLAGAVALRMLFGEAANFVPVPTSAVVPAYFGGEVYLLGCCAGSEDMRHLVGHGHQVTVVTAATKLSPRSTNALGRWLDNSTDASIGQMIWADKFGGQPVPALIAHVGDREMGARVSREGSAFLAALDDTPSTIQSWHDIVQMDEGPYAAFVRRGEVLEAAHNAVCGTYLAGAAPTKIAGMAATLVNAPQDCAKKVGMLLADQWGVVSAVWHTTTPSRVRVVLTGPRAVRVDGLAAAFNGSGTSRLAFFEIPSHCLPRLISGDLRPADVRGFSSLGPEPVRFGELGTSDFAQATPAELIEVHMVTAARGVGAPANRIGTEELGRRVAMPNTAVLSTSATST